MTRANLMIAALVLAGCTQQSETKGVPTSPKSEMVRPAEVSVSAPPTPTVSLPPTPSQEQKRGTTVRTIVVRQEGTTKGIEARITRIATDDKRFFFSSTNEQGIAQPNEPCDSLDRFVPEPSLPVYLKVRAKQCAESLHFDVPSARATQAMVLLGEEALKKDNFAQAHAYFASAAARLMLQDTAEATALENKSRIALGRSLGIENATTNRNGEEVLSSAALAKLREFQTQKGIAPSGTPDTATIEALVGFNERELLRRAEEVPKSKVEQFRKNDSVTPGVLRYDYRKHLETEAKAKKPPAETMASKPQRIDPGTVTDPRERPGKQETMKVTPKGP